jgi:hypothetical protein
MRGVALGLFALILSIGLFVSQVDAKNDKPDDKNKNESKFIDAKNDKQDDKNKYKYEYQYSNGQTNNNGRGSVPVPGTLLLFGGGFAWLMVRRTRDSRP